MQEPITEFFLEAPGGLVKVKAECLDKKVKSITIENLPSYVDKLEENIEVEEFGSVTVSTAFGGDSFVICNASDFNLSIHPSYAKDFVLSLWKKDLEGSYVTILDAKTKLQEYSLKLYKKLPEYVFLNTQGPRHNPIYKIAVSIIGSKKFIGEGNSKQRAEQDGASKLLRARNIY